MTERAAAHRYRMRLAVIQRYLDFKMGEVLHEVADELDMEGIRMNSHLQCWGWEKDRDVGGDNLYVSMSVLVLGFVCPCLCVRVSASVFLCV